MAGYSSDPKWPTTLYATTNQLEQELAHAQGFVSQPTGQMNFSSNPNPPQQQAPAIDRNLWPHRTQTFGIPFPPTPYQANLSHSASMANNLAPYRPPSDNTGMFPQQVSSQTFPQQSMFHNHNSADPYMTYPTSSITSPQYTTSPAMLQTGLPGNSTHSPPIPPPSTQTIMQSSPQARRPSDLARPGNFKRPRAPDRMEDDMDAEDGHPEAVETAKVKPPGACSRCKTLKVKCEFRTDTDPCKRCLNAGAECVIPGRKKRRPPPKREHLLNQIREQAEQIQRLMAQLEATNSQDSQRRQSGSSDALVQRRASSSGIQSPVLSPTSATFPGTDPTSPVSETNKAVEVWIEKARDSLAEFGGFIGLGGSGMPRSYLIDKDLEDSSDDEYEEVNDERLGRSQDRSNTRDEYDIAVVDSEGEEAGWSHVGTKTSKSKSRASSTHSGKEETSTSDAKLASLPSGAVPFGLMAQLSLKNPRSSSEEPEDNAEPADKEVGVANAGFFRLDPGADSERLKTSQTGYLPHILTRNIITIEEAEKLFKIYFDNMNLSLSLLDPVLYTAQRTCFRSPFLFTVICAIASRFYLEKPDLYAQVMHYAQLAAGTSLLNGPKSIEMCQGYLLLALYPVPARRWEEDRNWVFLGLAIRIAIDLNLHIPVTAQPKNQNHAREMLNRTRCYLNLFNVDRSMGSQYGKPPVLPNSDYIANHSVDWWKSSECNMANFDIHLCCYNAELRELATFRTKIYSNPEHPTGLNKDIDFVALCTEKDDRLQQLREEWMALIYQHTDMNDLQNSFRTGLLNLAFSYARLAILSYGFQRAFDKHQTEEEAILLHRCVTAAKDVVNVLLEDIGRPQYRIFLRHGPDAQQVFITFASAFLVKLLQPKFAMHFIFEERLEIRQLVKRVADLLGSPDIAVDARHGPRLYSRFLKGLLATPMAKIDRESHFAITNRNGGSRGPSASPMSRHSGIPSSTYSTPSPEATALTPPPSQAAMSFDQFADNAPLDPYAQPSLALQMEQYSNTTTSNGANNGINPFFSPPLPFDNEILSSMQSLTDPSTWQDQPLPGFNWMSAYQQDLNTLSQSSKTNLY